MNEFINKLQSDKAFAEEFRVYLSGADAQVAAYNPFEQAEDGLGVTILKNMAKHLDCRREGDRNRITISL